MRQYNIYPTLLDSFDWWRSQAPGARADKALQELMDKLNKRPFKGTLAMEKGTAFNELVDRLSKGEITLADSGLVEQGGFTFSLATASDIAKRVLGTQIQKYLQAIIPVDNYDVKVFGFSDYLAPDRIWELKTGGYYPGKFARRWQRPTYMACRPEVKKFTYLVTDFVNVYEETYEHPGREELIQTLREFVDFIESHRAEIQNPKLFGGVAK